MKFSAQKTQEAIQKALKSVLYPGFRRDIVSFGIVREVSLKEGHAEVQLTVTTAETKIPKLLKQEVEQALQAVPGVDTVKVLVDVHSPMPSSPQTPAGIQGVKHVIAVASGKGGVGKSTVALNLALALAEKDFKVGVCDCDLYGPSIAMMLGTRQRPVMNEKEEILPVEVAGLRVMSMGLLLEEEAPAVLRGPMVTRYTQQFLGQVAWGDLDYLILDLPPGTGDIQLTIVQSIALMGAVLVTTPQEVALLDVRKAASMFHKTNVRLLGLVENMSYFISPTDHSRHDIFGKAQGALHADALGIPLLGEIPIDPKMGVAGDKGVPFLLAHPHSKGEPEAASALRKIASKIVTK